MVEVAKVRTKDLIKVYRTGKSEVNALRRLDRTSGDGELVAVQGPTGGGKTTLLNLVGGSHFAELEPVPIRIRSSPLLLSSGFPSLLPGRSDRLDGLIHLRSKRLPCHEVEIWDLRKRTHDCSRR